MSASRSRRVQAQRKFAQGAYVPPNAAAVVAVDNRRDAAQDARNVTINNMTASNLLDVVSLQGLHTHLQPVVVVERLRQSNPCRDEMETVTEPQELAIDETDNALSVGNEFSTGEMQQRLVESSISNRSGPYNKDFNSDEDEYTNGHVVEGRSETYLMVDDCPLISLVQSENNNREPQTNEQHYSNKETTVEVNIESCLTDQEHSRKSKEILKESRTKGKTNAKGKSANKRKTNTKEKPYNKRTSATKGKGCSAKGKVVSKAISNKDKQPRINDDNSLASVLRALQKTKDNNLQKTHVMSLRQRRFSNGRIRATTAKKLQTLKAKNITNKNRTESSTRYSVSSEFSIDDNRPLTYYAQNYKTNKKSPKKRSHTSDPLISDVAFVAPSYPKRIMIEPYVPPPQPDPIPKRVQSHPAEPFAGVTRQKTILEPVPGPSGLHRVPYAPVAGPSGLQRVTSAPVAGPSGLQRVTSAPVAGPSGLHRVTYAPAAGPSGLHRVTYPPVAGPSGLQKVTSAPVAGPSGLHRVTYAPVASPSGLQKVTSAPAAGPSGLHRVTYAPVASPSGLQRVTSAPVAGPSGLQRVTPAPVAGPSGLQRVPSAPVAGPCGLQRVTSAPVAGPSGLQRVTSAPVAGPSGLQRVTSAPVAGPSGLQKRVLRNSGGSRGQTIESQDIKVLKCFSIPPCIAAKWGTVQQVINAPKEEMDSRCTLCVACLRIDKLTQLSKLLYRFDLTGTKETTIIESEPENDDEYDKDEPKPEENTGHIYLDLLPKHPRLMMKLRIHEVHGKQLLSACLIPKNDARKNNEDFLLEEKEHLLDQLINTLSISLPSEVLKSETSDVGNTFERLQGIITNLDDENDPECANPVEEPQANVEASCANVEVPQANAEAAQVNAEAAQVNAEAAQVNAEASQVNAEAAQAAVEAAQVNAEAPCANIEIPQANAEAPQATVQSRIVERHTLNNVYEEGDDAVNDANSDEEEDNYDLGEKDEQISADDLNESSADTIQTHAVGGALHDGPVFRPTKEEFQNPMEYFMKIWDEACEFGICKIIPPPGWRPKSQSCDGIRFDVAKQYTFRMFNRWGTAMRELACIKLCASRSNGFPCGTPSVGGMEVNLPKFYHSVQRHGGLELVLNKKRWSKVGRDMNLPMCQTYINRLDHLYTKYLLPYDSLSPSERREIFGVVEKAWTQKNQRLLDRALNPLRAQRRMMGLSDTEEEPEEQSSVMNAVKEAEDCIVRGPIMNYTRFKELSESVYSLVYGFGITRENNTMNLEQKEELYWRYVVQGNEHICVATAAIDTGSDPSRGSSRTLTLKDISQNKDNILRFLGAVSGLTAPTLNLGMAFSTNCFYLDPHAVSWLDLLYKGDPRIWYAIPAKQTENFRKAVSSLCPSFCQRKSLWLSTDIAMIPPQLLREYNVSVTRVVQEENEIILAFPYCYTSSINTGYSESESIYFAPVSWLRTSYEVFKEARENCEPTMFSLEELLLRIGKARGVDRVTLRAAQPIFDKVLRDEITNRLILQERGMKIVHQPDIPKPKNSGRRRRRNRTFIQEECEYCRATLFFSKVVGLVRNSYLCLEHALKLLTVKKMPITEDMQIITKVTIEELNNINDDMKRRIENGEESGPEDLVD